MAQRRALELSKEQRETLEAGRDHHPHPAVRERCAALLKIASGMSPHRVAQHGLVKARDPDTVYAWLDRYQQEGLAGLLAHRQGGYHRRRL
jgi:transposase